MNLVAPAAVLVDAAFGEPPAALHPTVWMGRWIAAWRRPAPREPHWQRFVAGAGLTLSGAAMAGAAAWVVTRGLRQAAAPLALALEAALLKPTLAVSALLDAGRSVERALRAGDLDAARRLTSRHLVSRDTTTLSASEVAGATVSSLAENLSDSIVAPLVAYRAMGLAGAYVYRFINTADSMLGYRTPELEWLGKFAARADDVANLLPARLSALLVALSAPVSRGSTSQALRVAWRDAGVTASPNAGWPMAAMAGALGVRLTKRGHYTLHAQGGEPNPNTIARARRIVAISAVAITAACVW